MSASRVSCLQLDANTRPLVFVAGEGHREESALMAEGEVSETFVQAGLLHTKELRKVSGGGPHDFRSFRRGLKGS